MIELALKDTLNLLEYPLRHRGIVFPDLHTILKLAIILVSTNPGIKVILTAKLILAGICPLSGVNPKNCSSNYPFPLSLSMWNYVGTSELFFIINSLVIGFVTKICPKSI